MRGGIKGRTNETGANSEFGTGHLVSFWFVYLEVISKDIFEIASRILMDWIFDAD